MLNDTQLAIARQILNLGGKLDTKFSTMFIEEVESLQQQNARMREGHERIIELCKELSPQVNSIYLILQQSRKAIALQSLQGGTSNAVGS